MGPSVVQKCFGTLPQICASISSCLGGLWTLPWTSWLIGPLRYSTTTWDQMQNAGLKVVTFQGHTFSAETFPSVVIRPRP